MMTVMTASVVETEHAPTMQEVMPPPKPDKHGYLFGQKIKASMSPLFHKTIYDALGLNWEQLLLESTDIPSFLRLMQDPRVFGAAVTMPNKVAIVPYLDEMTEECREVGACNTIFVRDCHGRRVVCGANTDVIGVKEAFYQNVAHPDAVFHDRPALVIGGGGAARSAVYALNKWLRATIIYLINRDRTEVEAVMDDCRSRGYGHNLVHVSSVEQAQGLEVPGAIVACVPDFPPQTVHEKLARVIVEIFLKKERKGAMLEMCYNPTPYTQLGSVAEREGWQVILGTEAMIWQGLEQDKYWTGLDVKDMPIKQVSDVIARQVSLISRL